MQLRRPGADGWVHYGGSLSGDRHEGMDYIVLTAGGSLVDGGGRGDYTVAYRVAGRSWALATSHRAPST